MALSVETPDTSPTGDGDGVGEGVGTIVGAGETTGLSVGAGVGLGAGEVCKSLRSSTWLWVWFPLLCKTANQFI